MPSQKCILGVDQGGTKTQVALADLEGNILGTGISGGGYHSIHGLQPAMEEVAAAVAKAQDQAGIKELNIVGMVAGMTGADFEYEYDILQSAFSERYKTGFLKVVNDSIIALRAGDLTISSGVVLCAGTGLNCAIKTPEGEEFIYGYYIPELWQGAGALGEMALQAVFDSSVGMGNKTSLTDTVLQRLQQKDVDSLLHSRIKRELSTEQICLLVPLIDEAAKSGDAVAIDILKKFGKQAAAYAMASIRRFDMNKNNIPVVLTGGVFKGQSHYIKDEIIQEICSHFPMTQVIEGKFEPVVGALLMAFDKISTGITVDEKIGVNISDSARRFHLIRKPEEAKTESK